MSKKSAGILVYRNIKGEYQVLLVHPGGPFWSKKDLNSWSVPKGEFSDDEEPFAAAKREFNEETGFNPDGNFIKLDPVKQPGGKMVYVWCVEYNIDSSAVKSNSFSLEWPPDSGNIKEYPEIDKAEWFSFETAKQKINSGQVPLIDALSEVLLSAGSQ